MTALRAAAFLLAVVHALFRRGLSSPLRAGSDIAGAGEAGDGLAAIAQAQALRPEDQPHA